MRNKWTVKDIATANKIDIEVINRVCRDLFWWLINTGDNIMPVYRQIKLVRIRRISQFLIKPAANKNRFRLVCAAYPHAYACETRNFKQNINSELPEEALRGRWVDRDPTDGKRDVLKWRWAGIRGQTRCSTGYQEEVLESTEEESTEKEDQV